MGVRYMYLWFPANQVKVCTFANYSVPQPTLRSAEREVRGRERQNVRMDKEAQAVTT